MQSSGFNRRKFIFGFSSLAAVATHSHAGTITSKARWNAINIYDISTLKHAAYGAKGDGVTDDTIAILKWLTAITGKSGFIPPGTYITEGFDLPSNTTIDATPGTVTLKKKASSALAHLIRLSSTTNQVINGINLDGNKANQSKSSCVVRIDAATNFRLTDMDICGGYNSSIFGDGVYFGNSAPSRGELTRVVAHDNDRQGFAFVAASDIQLNHCEGFNSGNQFNGIDIEPVAGSVKRISIVGGSFHNNYHGIYVAETNTSGISIAASTRLSHNAATGINVSNHAQGVTIDSPICTSNGRHHIFVNNHGRGVTITRATFFGDAITAGMSCIAVDGAAYGGGRSGSVTVRGCSGDGTGLTKRVFGFLELKNAPTKNIVTGNNLQKWAISNYKYLAGSGTVHSDNVGDLA